MPKKILFTVTTDLRHDQRMQRIAGSLAKAGHLVTLLGRQLPFSLPLIPADYCQKRLSCFFHKGPLFYVEFNLRLFLYLLWQPPQVLGMVDADTALAGVLASYLRKISITYDAHELFPELPEVVGRPWVRCIWTWLERLAFQKADKSYTVSASIAHYFKEKYHRPVQVVRNMPVASKTLPVAHQPAYFIYQGALNEGRGLECLLHAMVTVEASLLICGTGPMESSLKNQALALGLQEKVKFLGNKTPEELTPLTQQAHAGVMLLEEKGLSYYYSLANKFFDYVQAGIPQVCIAFQEYAALNQAYEVALLVDLEPGLVAEALRQLLEDKAVYQRLQTNCYKARQVWNWEKESQALLQIYEPIT